MIDSSTPTDTKVNNDLHFHFEGLLMILVRLFLDSIDRNQKVFCSFCYWSVIILIDYDNCLKLKTLKYHTAVVEISLSLGTVVQYFEMSGLVKYFT